MESGVVTQNDLTAKLSQINVSQNPARSGHFDTGRPLYFSCVLVEGGAIVLAIICTQSTTSPLEATDKDRIKYLMYVSYIYSMLLL